MKLFGRRADVVREVDGLQVSIERKMSVGVLSEHASNWQVRRELGEHADNGSDSHFPLDAKQEPGEVIELAW